MILLFLGCDELQSTDVVNADLALSVQVASDGAITQIDAKIQRGQGLGWTPVHVAEPETLVPSVSGVDLVFEAIDLGLGDVVYTTTSDTGSGGVPVSIRFDRTADDSIGETSLTVPPDFTITAPAAGAGVAADTALIVLWDAAWADGTIDLTFSGSCIPGWEVSDADDVGEIDIPAEALAAEGSACGATLTLIRTVTGSVNEAWGAGGTTSAQNGRTVTVAVGN